MSDENTEDCALAFIFGKLVEGAEKQGKNIVMTKEIIDNGDGTFSQSLGFSTQTEEECENVEESINTEDDFIKFIK